LTAKRVDGAGLVDLDRVVDHQLDRFAGGLIFFGSPPIRCMASRMAARSTTEGTPVKSWRRNPAGAEGDLEGWGSPWGPSSPGPGYRRGLTVVSSSFRSRFSRRILSENGRRVEVDPLVAEGVEAVVAERPDR